MPPSRSHQCHSAGGQVSSISRAQKRGQEEKEEVPAVHFFSYYLIRNQHQPHKPHNRKNAQKRMVVEAGLLQTWDLHEGVAPGTYHQENTRKKAEVEKDDFYFQEGNGQKKSLVEPRSFATLGGTPGLRQSAQWVIWRSGNTLVRGFVSYSSVL